MRVPAHSLNTHYGALKFTSRHCSWQWGNSKEQNKVLSLWRFHSREERERSHLLTIYSISNSGDAMEKDNAGYGKRACWIGGLVELLFYFS